MVMVAEKKGLVQVLTSWVLLTYDIPVSLPKVRYQFLKKARALGACRYSQSCYLLPNVPSIYQEAQDLAAIGEAYLWVSEIKEPIQALKVTQTFYSALALRLQVIQNRIGQLQALLLAGRLSMAYRMAMRTVDMLERVERLAQASQFQDLLPLVEETGQALQDILHGGTMK